MKQNKGFNLISVIIIIFVTSIASAITAGIIVTNNYNLTYKGLADDKELNEFIKTYSNIINNYIILFMISMFNKEEYYFCKLLIKEQKNK